MKKLTNSIFSLYSLKGYHETDCKNNAHNGIYTVVSCLLASPRKKHFDPQKNLIKVNLTSLPLSNYNGQLERILGKKISIAVSYRYMLLGNIPFKNDIVKIANGDAGEQKTIDQLLVSSSAITPELIS